MNYTPKEAEVLLKYRLIDAEQKLIQVNLERPVEKPPGAGPKMEGEAVQRLLNADSTPERLWLDWIFFQAGGGQRAKEASARAMEQMEDRFICERVNGFDDPVNNKHYAPVPRSEAVSRWEAVKAEWLALMESADQDIVDHLGVFGYHRAWPGKDSIYERVAKVVQKFSQLREKATQMNKELQEQAVEKVVSFKPEDYADIDALEKTNRSIERYFASKKARNDIQVEHIYEDDEVRVLAPLTYAASVRYGYDGWPFSNRATFEDVLSSDQSFRDAWRNVTQRSVLVFISWKIPMPSWVHRKDNNFIRCELTNLALELNRTSKEGSEPVIHDEESTAPMQQEQLFKMLREEPTRSADPAEEEMPVKRGPNAYTSAAEAERRVNKFDAVVRKVHEWIGRFDASRIKTEVYPK